jgi:hypothetical protein
MTRSGRTKKPPKHLLQEQESASHDHDEEDSNEIVEIVAAVSCLNLSKPKLDVEIISISDSDDDDDDDDTEEQVGGAVAAAARPALEQELAEQARQAEARKRTAALMRPFTNDEQAQVTLALKDSGPKDEVIARAGAVTVQRGSIQCLQPGEVSTLVVVVSFSFCSSCLFFYVVVQR